MGQSARSGTMLAMADTLGRQIGGVLFDLDNTLWDRDAAFRRWAERFAEGRLALAPDSTAWTAALKWLVRKDNAGYGSKPALFTELREQYRTLRTESVEDLVESFHAALMVEGTMEPETVALLERMADMNIPLGIVTNGSARQQRKIEHLGLDRYTTCIFISEVFGGRKPNPEIFYAAASQLRQSPVECLFVGDHPENDIQGAQRVGMQTAWLPRGNEWPVAFAATPPGIHLDSLADLPRYL